MITSTALHGRTILIVDDVPANLAVAVDYLESHNFTVMVAQDGEEGIERAQMIQPDLILLDVMMPGIDGFEACRRLKAIKSTREIPVIFMTALTDISDKVTAFEVGAADYVSKPFQMEELLSRITTHLTLHAVQQQLITQNAQLHASELYYRGLFEAAQDGILLLDLESGKITDVNESVVNLLGYKRDHYLDRKLWEIVPFRDISACQRAFSDLQIMKPVSFEHWLLRKEDKSPINIEFVAKVYQVGTAKIAQCNIRDITGRIQAEERVHYMALHDALTGLPNRTLLQDRLYQAIAMASRNQKHVAVIMLDLDRFKSINDSLGHQIGDGLLQAVAKRLITCLRSSDIVARLGGDEFVIALPAVDGSYDSEEVIQKALASLREPYNIEGHDMHISGSMGVALYPDDADSPSALLRAADIAMYAAKAAGRGRYMFFTSDLSVAPQRRLTLVNDLCDACEREELVLYYQPLISAESGSITGVEALLRWKHPLYGMIFPMEFIPILEEMELIVGVGKWVLKTACMQNAAWQKKGLAPVRMSVNLSAHQFYHGDLLQTVEAALRDSQLNPKWLDLELTEGLSLEDSDVAINIMQELKRVGVGLSLDDFGTGWSSLNCLRRFPLDRIKIDRSFMREITTDPAAQMLVSSIIELAKKLGMGCTAEGVETIQELNYLKKTGCSEVQGFLYSHPLTALDCETLMREKM